MPKQSKYIIVEERGLEMPIVFSPILSHADIAKDKKVISAGFCYRNDLGEFSCYGESFTLKVKSRGREDAEILDRYLEYDC